MSQDFLSSVLGQIIVANLTNVRKVTAQTKPDFMKPEKKNKQTSNAIQLLKLTSRDAVPESDQVSPESLKTFKPSCAFRVRRVT